MATLGFVAAVCAFFAFVGAASATVYSGARSDPSGDGPAPGRDVINGKARYDSASGALDFEVRLKGAPEGDLQITTGIGRLTDSGSCRSPLIALGTFFPSGSTVWILETDGSSPAEQEGDGTRTVSGSTVSLKAVDSRLKGLRPDCADVILSDPADPSVVYDQVSTFPVKPPPPKPRLRARAGKIPSLKRGTARTIAFRVSNTGNARAHNVVVRAAAKGAASLKPRLRKLGSIPAGKSKVARFRLKVNRRGKGKVKVTARVSGKKVKAHAATSFRIRVPRPPPPPSTGGLAGKMYWAFENYRWDRSPDLVFLHFTNRRLVRWGMPKGGLKGCRGVTAKIRKGEMQPGCLRYRFNRRTGQVRIGKVRGTFRGGKLKLKMDDDVWSTSGAVWNRGLAARPGTRFKTRLINRGYFGACGITPYCSTWLRNVQLTRGGRFGRQSSSITTGGTPGVNFIAISKLGPDERGRYRILSGSRIRFNFANGRKLTETLIVQTNKRGRPDPVREGLLLDGEWYYRDTD